MSDLHLNITAEPVHKWQKSLTLWGEWVAANALAELIGLGTSALLWIAFFLHLEESWVI